MNETNWIPGMVVLGVGLFFAALYILFGKKRLPAADQAGVAQVADLDERYRRTLEQLRELEADKSHLDAEAYAAQRGALERAAADVLRKKDGIATEAAAASATSAASTTTAAPAKAAPTGFAARNPQLVGALWGAGVVGFFVVLGLVLSGQTKERGENDSITGADPNERAGTGGKSPMGGRPGSPGMGATPESPLEQAIAAAKANPSDLEALSFASHELLMRQDWDEAEKFIERGLSADPFNIELRIHRGVLRGVKGDQRGSLEELEKLMNLYPGTEEAMLFGGAMAMQFNEPAVALRFFERFAVEQPKAQHPPQLASAITELRAKLGK